MEQEDIDRYLRIGDSTEDGRLNILDIDRIAVEINLFSRNNWSKRVLSRAIILEYLNYMEQHSDATPDSLRETLSGTTDRDKFEYGYSSSIFKVSRLILEKYQNAVGNGEIPSLHTSSHPHQQIYYGAPGTGKSYGIKRVTDEWEKKNRVVRTTFHPDSDYSTFVGAYKPTTKRVVMRDLSGHRIEENGVELTEDKIVYKFIPQAFLHAYVSAWKNREEPEYLVIEEINRGNCAQIFGDLFQLLDRNEAGFSEYAIAADQDLQRYLQEAFADTNMEEQFAQIKSGEKLLLPNNLYIWATMNTSDQSLFPIDSAFKRRWDWKYMPITDAGLNWQIAVNGNAYDWWQFLEKINTQIASTTNSEDKKLGYFFCKTQNGTIDAETFVGKVCFYLWNDVFKDYGLDGPLFQLEDGSFLTFDRFYGTNAQTIRLENVEHFLKNLGLEPVAESDSGDPQDDDVEENDRRKPRRTMRYDVSIGGVPVTGATNKERYLNTIRQLPLDTVVDIAKYAAGLHPTNSDEHGELRNTARGGNLLVSELPFNNQVATNQFTITEQNGKTYYIQIKLTDAKSSRFLRTIAKLHPEMELTVDYAEAEPTADE